MKLTKNMIEKIWNARDTVCGMDGWVAGKQYAYKAAKWDESNKKNAGSKVPVWRVG